MGSIWSKSRACYPNRSDCFSPFLRGFPLKASSPCPLNWLCLARRGDDEIIDPEVFDPPLSGRSPNLSPSQKAWNSAHFIISLNPRAKLVFSEYTNKATGGGRSEDFFQLL